MLQTCIQCGVCSSSCSVRYELNLRKLIANFLGKKHFWDQQLWNCTNCRICEDRCPRGIKLTEQIVKAKKEVLERGFVPQEIIKFLENVRKFGNPFGRGKRWYENLEIKIAERGDFDFLFFAGCATFDEKIAEVARKAVKLLNFAGVNFAVLRDESCCGNDVLAIGEEGLFELLKEKNMKIFEEVGAKKILTLSPHCYNAFKNYYEIKTYHVTEVLSKAIEKAEIKFTKVLEKVVTFHDPCYLGRYNRIYDAPRKILEYIPGIKFLEMQRSKDLSICCGGGAGNVVRYMKNRPSMMRVEEASSLGAELLVTSCPFCFMMLEDDAKLKNLEVKDVIDLVYDSVF
ncbi:MAG: (Fe-S)-binding protein [Archaeoglobaceae archaeon]|nr:(Fe-S)-binding protein [Archaeoglobaceae archaeon]MDW8014010.1 (Fe-S)-binding protein [Archaeoglobaceae archaeon]